MALDNELAAVNAAGTIEPTRNLSAFEHWLNNLPEGRKERLRKSLADAYANPLPMDVLQKTSTTAFATGVGLQPYSLEAPALNLWSVVTPFVNKLPREKIGSTGHHWNRITSVDAVESYGFVAEPTDTTANTVTGRAGFNTITSVADSVAWKTLGLDSYVTFKARYQAQGSASTTPSFAPDQVARLAALQALRMREEKAILGSNASALATPGAPSTTGITQPASTAGSLTANTAYKITISALTNLGYRSAAQGKVGGTTNSPGETVAAASTSITTAASGAGSTAIAMKWTAVPGAVAYNVFADTAAGDGRVYMATVTTNTYTLSTLTPTGYVAANVPNTTGTSADSNGYNGLISLLAANGGYVKSLDGAALSGTKNYIAELDTAFQYQFTHYQLGATQVYMSAADLRKAIDVVTGSSAPYVRLDAKGGDVSFVGGLGVKGVLNNYTQKEVDFIVHPYMPPGTMLLWCDNLGEYYPNANIPQPVTVGLGMEYLSVDWAPTALRQEFGIYVDEAPILRAGFPLGIISNVG